MPVICQGWGDKTQHSRLKSISTPPICQRFDIFWIIRFPLFQVDFAALKKALPTHAATIDSLQKQYEAVKIPYGEVPKEYLDVIFLHDLFLFLALGN